MNTVNAYALKDLILPRQNKEEEKSEIGTTLSVVSVLTLSSATQSSKSVDTSASVSSLPSLKDQKSTLFDPAQNQSNTVAEMTPQCIVTKDFVRFQ